MTEAAQQAKPQQKRRTGRSPSYPSFSLKKALDQAHALFEQEGEYAAPLPSAMGAWGYSAKSSGGRQTLATLKYFGLIDIDGEGDARRVRVSSMARRIFLDKREDKSEKMRLIRAAALTPNAHKAIHAAYPKGLASDGSVTHTLIWDLGFKPDAASDLLAEYKETAAFAGIYEPDDSLDKRDAVGDSGGGETKLPRVAIGDKIQCTVHGSYVFDEPATVLGISEDGKWVFTDQSETGAPLEGVTVIEASAREVPRETSSAGDLPPTIPEHLRKGREKPQEREAPAGMREEKSSLDEGEVVLWWPEELSAESVADFEYWVNGIVRKAKRRAGLG